MSELGRLITAMVTPFDDQGEVAYDQAKALAEALLASGSDGLVVSGTTGESPTLTSQEKLRLFREIKDAVGNRGSVIAGTGGNSTGASIELSRAAEGDRRRRFAFGGAVLQQAYAEGPVRAFQGHRRKHPPALHTL